MRYLFLLIMLIGCNSGENAKSCQAKVKIGEDICNDYINSTTFRVIDCASGNIYINPPVFKFEKICK